MATRTTSRQRFVRRNQKAPPALNPQRGPRRFIVSLAGPDGGKQCEVLASNDKEALAIAVQKKFPNGKVPPSTEAVVTDTTKQRNRHTFYDWPAKRPKV